MQKNNVTRVEYAGGICKRNMQDDNAGVFMQRIMHAINRICRSTVFYYPHGKLCIYMQEYAYSLETRGYNYVFDRIWSSIALSTEYLKKLHSSQGMQNCYAPPWICKIFTLLPGYALLVRSSQDMQHCYVLHRMLCSSHDMQNCYALPTICRFAKFFAGYEELLHVHHRICRIATFFIGYADCYILHMICRNAMFVTGYAELLRSSQDMQNFYMLQDIQNFYVLHRICRNAT